MMLKKIIYYYSVLLTGRCKDTGVRDKTIAKVNILGSKECKLRFPDITDNHICITTPDKEYCRYMVNFNDPDLMKV